jgi:DNA-binding NarL/FixJ family response regulator
MPGKRKISLGQEGEGLLLQYCGRILIVDDDGGFRALVATLLAEAGLGEAVEAATGRDALAAMREERPALVLLDVRLPDISGFQVCRTLRDELGEDLPVIFVSGERVEPADRAVGLLVGADDYVVKPVDPDELLARMRRAITRSCHELPAAATPRAFELTAREQEILERFAEGQSQAEIAEALVISPKTVASHAQRILAKLGVHSRAQAVAAAYRLGLIGTVRS